LKINKSGKTLPAWFFPLFIAIFVFILYGNCIKNNYSLDDDIVTATQPTYHNNTRIEKGISGIPTLFTTRHVESTKQSYGYRPLTLATFALEYSLFKSNPHISHFLNVLLFVLTGLLLFKILKNLFSQYHVLFPFLVTLLFLAHPLHTEVVNSIKNRDEILCFFFGISSVHFAIKYFEIKKIWAILCSAMMLWLAFLSKETAIVFLPLIPLTIYYFKPVRLPKLILSALLVILTLLIFNLTRMFLLHGAPVDRVYVFTENPLFYEINIYNRLFPGLYALGYYLKLLFIPYPLSAYYGYDAIPMADHTYISVWISLIIYLALGIFALIKLPKKNILSFGILFFLVGIVPYSNILRPAVGIVAERFAYTASLGFCIVIVWLLLGIFKIPLTEKKIDLNKILKPAFIFSMILILGIYSGMTIARNNKWKDILTLLRNDVKHFDNSYNLHFLLVNTLGPMIADAPSGIQKNQMIEEALVHYRSIAKIVESGISKYPSDYISRNNLGTIYVNYLQDAGTAKKLFKEAIAAKPDYVEAHYNLGFAYEQMSVSDSAIFYYEKTLTLDSLYLKAYTKLHNLYFEKSNIEKLLIVDKKAVKNFPDNAEFFINLGNTYISMKDTLSCISSFKKALQIEPDNNSLRVQIVTFLKKSGKNDEAKKLEMKNN